RGQDDDDSCNPARPPRWPANTVAPPAPIVLAADRRTAQPTSRRLEGQCRGRSDATGEPPLHTASCGGLQGRPRCPKSEPQGAPAEGLVEPRLRPTAWRIPLRPPGATPWPPARHPLELAHRS